MEIKLGLVTFCKKNSHNLWLWLKGHNFTSLIFVFGKKRPNRFSDKGILLAFCEVASASSHPAFHMQGDEVSEL